MKREDFLHEMKHIIAIRKSVKNIIGYRADQLREKAMQRSMNLLDIAVHYIPEDE